jgi:hypothetical protein
MKKRLSRVLGAMAIMAGTTVGGLMLTANPASANPYCANTGGNEVGWWGNWEGGAWIEVPSYCPGGYYKLWVNCGNIATWWMGTGEITPGQNTSVVCMGPTNNWHVDYRPY